MKKGENGIRVVRFEFADKILYSLALEIREKVFIHEQKVTRRIEIENEEESHYYLAFLDSKAAACARWRETTSGIKLERFATLREYREKGLAAWLLKEMLKDTIVLEKEIYLHAQESAVGFYKKYGFETEGEKFYEAGIAHYLMKLKINPVL